VQPADSTRPPDLGYFLGFRIAEAWYRRNATRPDRVAALVGIDDYRRFLAESGYDGGRTHAAPVARSGHVGRRARVLRRRSRLRLSGVIPR
jgi:hypothetical protein